MKYLDILKDNQKLKEKVAKEEIFKITVLSNIVINRLKDYLEYYLRKQGINCVVDFGDYDNIVQDTRKYKKSDLIIFFCELCNIIDGLQYKIELFDDNQLKDFLNQIKSEIDLIYKNLENTSLILLNKFTSLHFSNSYLRKNNLEKLSDQLNNYLEDKIQTNVKLIDLEKVIASVGVEKSLDLRYYYSSKALYTNIFLETYVKYIKPYIMSSNGKTKKALIFDCDNTLWKGILGEDGFDKIEMSPNTKEGSIFSEVQSIALSLNKQGILIGLCSKNNSKDVEEVIKSHPDMQLREQRITINKSNWLDKITNLRDICKELNIGLDSVVFVDDSSFEVNLIRELLPEITVLQVPDRLYNYPKMLRENLGLFYNISFTKEDEKKIVMYKQQAWRERSQSRFSDIEDYLASLELKMTIFEDDESIIPRMSQMSQKTNQFNLTTKRYAERSIRNFVTADDFNVFAISVSDKCGVSGVTGLCIIKIDKKNQTADIDTFLMSCRIIGRNIEYAFMDYLISFLSHNKIENITAKYIKTQKNEQVKEFYDRCSFSLFKNINNERNYKLFLNKYEPKNYKYIKLENG